MWKLLFYSLIQSSLLAGGQVFLKMSLDKISPFSWSVSFFKGFVCNWSFALFGICFALASILWLFILKNFPLSMAYPLLSLSFVMGTLAAFAFGEQIPSTRWLGLLLIIIGCILTAKNI